MTEKSKNKRRRLSLEILGLIGISALLALILFLILSRTAATIAEVYIFQNDVVMTEFDWLDLEKWIFFLSTAISGSFFTVLFLILLGDRLAYIRKLTQGIDALRMGQEDHVIALEGNNELTALAEAINDMSAARRELRQRELALAQEKEQFIRTLSHDIRTPLTSILAYSDYLATAEDISDEERWSYQQLIQKKALQIRELTDILLDGGTRKPEHFSDAGLLMAQLAAEFEELLEEQFTVHADLNSCHGFSGCFDVGELRRIFDNLGSNVRKYADPDRLVELAIYVDAGDLVVRQSNAVLPQEYSAESYKLGISSIRRIVQHYGGQVAVEQDAQKFEIMIRFSEF